MLTPSGTQSWYSAMRPIMMKKWKCASMVPLVITTSAIEQYVRPVVLSTAAARRQCRTPWLSPSSTMVGSSR
jgi:hypothetical protein